MEINLTLRFERPDHKPLCFTHAVKAAMDGTTIDVTIEQDQGSEYDCRQTWCEVCE